MELLGFGAFFFVWLVIMLGSVAGLICGAAALISIAQTEVDRFGPWWDNTKTSWLLGVAVGFVVPFGTLVTGIYWFWKGRAPLTTTGLVERPFWAGPPKPPPLQPPWGYAPQPPYPPQYPGYPPQHPGYPPHPPPPAGQPQQSLSETPPPGPPSNP